MYRNMAMVSMGVRISLLLSGFHSLGGGGGGGVGGRLPPQKKRERERKKREKKGEKERERRGNVYFLMLQSMSGLYN